MHKTFIIRNQEDYLRAHITVLRRNPQKSGSVVAFRDRMTRPQQSSRAGTGQVDARNVDR